MVNIPYMEHMGYVWGMTNFGQNVRPVRSPSAHIALPSNMAMESPTFIDNCPIATSFYRDFPASHV